MDFKYIWRLILNLRGGETIGRPREKKSGTPAKVLKNRLETRSSIISRKNFSRFSTDFFENKGPPLCFFEKSPKIAKNRKFETFSQNAEIHKFKKFSRERILRPRIHKTAGGHGTISGSFKKLLQASPPP